MYGIEKIFFQLVHIEKLKQLFLGNSHSPLWKGNSYTSGIQKFEFQKIIQKIFEIQYNSSNWIKNCAPELAPILTRVSQISYDNGICHSKYITFWKIRSKALLSHYRTIAIFSVCSKVKKEVSIAQSSKSWEMQINQRKQNVFWQKVSTFLMLFIITPNELQSYGFSPLLGNWISKFFYLSGIFTGILIMVF